MKVLIAEKPSVARQFADALGLPFQKHDGYLAAGDTMVTWCVGHLVTMSYPDAYDPKYKKWSLDTIPFIPKTFRYEVIGTVKKQYGIVKKILTDKAVDTIYICTDSGREGEYIYRLVAQQARVKNKKQLRVWIDSQTKDEILRGIRQAKDDSAYDNLGAAAYLRAKEDYLMGINFSRALTLRYGKGISAMTGADYSVIAVGRVMTCVLGMVVRREREIRDFVKTPFYRVQGVFTKDGAQESVTAQWHAAKGSIFENSPALYNEKGFNKREDAQKLIDYLLEPDTAGKTPVPVTESVRRRKEKKYPPLLYNLAELQNDGSRFFKISPDETLQAAQELYEKRLTTYPRTDARVLSSAVAREIGKNLGGISKIPMFRPYLQQILTSGSYKTIGKTRYTNDSAITDHYAIIPTGQGLQNLSSLSPVTRNIYELICRRFLAVFYPPAVFDKIAVDIRVRTELFSAGSRTCIERGYLDVLQYSFARGEGKSDESASGAALLSVLKKGDFLTARGYEIKEGETQPPRRYTSGSMILAMENAGQLIENEELREQIKGSGIGTSATRAEILKKLFSNRYLSLAKRTQVITPTFLGEMIYDTVDCSIRPLLDPRLTASWEMGLTRVSEGTVSEEEYMQKLSDFIIKKTDAVKDHDYSEPLQKLYERDASFYSERQRKAFAKRYKKGGRRTAARTKHKTPQT